MQNADTNADTDVNTNTDANADTDTNDADTNTNADTDANANANANANLSLRYAPYICSWMKQVPDDVNADIFLTLQTISCIVTVNLGILLACPPPKIWVSSLAPMRHQSGS